MSEPAWLIEGRKDIGFHETGENRGIEKFIEQAQCGSLGDPWCAIWVNAKLQSAGIRGTRSPAAISFSQNSNFIACAPRLGAIVVFKRTGGNHVGFYVGMDSQGRLLVLGGNQRDQVCIEPHENNPLGYWWPAQLDLKVNTAPGDHPLTVQYSGKGSWYSQYNGKYSWTDSGDAPGSAALGCPDDAQGIALPPSATLGNWYAVRAPNGKVSIEQQTDRGPGVSTGRLIDISAAAAERFGYSPHNFPTNGIFTWWPIDPPAQVAGLAKSEQAVKYRDIRKGLPMSDTTPAPPVPPIPLPDAHPEIKLGATGAAVTELQKLLNIPQTGFFDFATKATVESFQQAHGLDPDGEVGADTWPVLADPSKAPPKPIALPALPGLPKIDILQGLHYIVSGDRGKVREDLKLFLDVFNAKNHDIAIGLPSLPAPPPPSSGSVLNKPSVQMGTIGVVASGVLHQFGVLDPNMAILGAIVSAGTAFLGPSGVIVGKVLMGIARAAKSIPKSP